MFFFSTENTHFSSLFMLFLLLFAKRLESQLFYGMMEKQQAGNPVGAAQNVCLRQDDTWVQTSRLLPPDNVLIALQFSIPNCSSLHPTLEEQAPTVWAHLVQFPSFSSLAAVAVELSVVGYPFVWTARWASWPLLSIPSYLAYISGVSGLSVGVLFAKCIRQLPRGPELQIRIPASTSLVSASSKWNTKSESRNQETENEYESQPEIETKRTAYH